MEWRLELVQVPVSNVDRAKTFYAERVGFAVDIDVSADDGVRFVQLTPPGSPCSIAIGSKLTRMRPGTVEGLQLVVADIHAAREDLVASGVEVSEVEEYAWGAFIYFRDPDGNGWSVQQPPEQG